MHPATHPRHRSALASGAFAVLVASTGAHAAFGTPASTRVVERIVGVIVPGTSNPVTPAASDQVGAFFNDRLVGAFIFNETTAASGAFEVLVFGDDPDTTEIEGPRAGQPVVFRYFDASANTTRSDVRVENSAAEPFNYTYAGEEFPPGLVELLISLGITDSLFSQTRELNLRVGVGTLSGTGGGGTPGTTPVRSRDVDANGVVDERDVALILRLVSGASRDVPASTLARADVTGDGRVNTDDAIEVVRASR